MAHGSVFVVKEDVAALFQELSAAEKCFTYCIFRAGLPFNHMLRQQNHIHTNEIIALCERVYHNYALFDPKFVEDLKQYLVFLWTNHGFYAKREHSNSKKTPEKLGLQHLTRDRLEAAIVSSGVSGKYEHLLPYIFDPDLDINKTDDGHIETSGGNFYGPDFTKEHYELLPEVDKGRINAYFTMKDGKPETHVYSTKGYFGDALRVANHWLGQALEICRSSPKHFDTHFTASLGFLIAYFETGDEELYKKHCVEWIHTKSRLDYTVGFIETYSDPMSVRGDAGAEVTVKTVNLEALNPVLLELERRLPTEYRRKDASTLVNVSVNRILFSGGDYGPTVCTAAYCLPNYDDVRSKHGSKQIIYKLPESTSQLLNPDLVKQFRTQERQDFIDAYDPENKMMEDMWDMQVILHETVGHASGCFGVKTFTEDTMVGETVYKAGDTVNVTDDNYSLFMTKDSSSLEELRAEINALYMSVYEVDTLVKHFPRLFHWYMTLGLEEVQKQCIIAMAKTHLSRLYGQPKDFTKITGAHARANAVIGNYLLAHGAIVVTDDIKLISGEYYHLLGMKVVDLPKALDAVKSLCTLVQEIKSTADLSRCQTLFDTFTTSPLTIAQANLYSQYIEQNQKALIGNIKSQARLYPNYQPITRDGKLIDVVLGDEMDIYQQQLYYSAITFSCM